MTFTSFNRGGSFQPEQVSSPLQAYDENVRKQQAAEQQYLAGMRDNDRVRLQDLQRAFSGLEKISTSLTQYAEQKRNEFQKKEMQRGMYVAYTGGVPQQDRDDLDEQERQGEALDKQTREVANKVEQDGDPYTAQNIRKMSAWAQYGYAVQSLQMGGAAYGSHFAEKRSTTKVNIDGEDFTYDTARTPQQRAAVSAQIRQDYLDRFAEFNPVMAAKYMFPSIQKFEEKEAIKWSDAYAKRLQSERKTEAKDALSAGLYSENGGEAYLNLINTRASDFGGAGAARKAAAEMLIEMIDNEQITETQVRALMGHEFVHRGMGRTTIGKAFKRDFVKVELKLQQARLAKSKRAQQELTARRNEFNDNFLDLVAERDESGVPLTDKEIDELNLSYRDQGLGLKSTYLDNYRTAEERDVDEAKEFLEARKATRGYYIESDLDGMPTSVRAAYRDQVKRDSDITAASQETTSSANRRITGAVNDQFQYEEGKTKPTGGYEKYERVLGRAQRDYQTQFRNLMLSGKFDDTNAAHEAALAIVNGRVADGSYLTLEVKTNTERQQQLVDLRASLLDPKAPPASGMMDDVEQAVAYFQTQNGTLPEGVAPVRSLPDIFNIAASGTSSTGIDVALSELAKRGIVGLKKPAVEEKVDTLSPVHRSLLRKPTAGRLNRVMLEQGDDVSWMLDTIASVESKDYGEYDAFNRGGTNNGYTAIGPGNSQTDLDKPISTMTLGEIMARHDRGELHAVGRYQFIKDPFIEVMALTGLPEDTVFSPEIQDLFAITRAKQRVSWRGGTQGLINEWRGLKAVSQEERERLLTVIQNLGPYNDPSNTLPGLKYN
jgi:muramidase (phage lysozyme)